MSDWEAKAAAFNRATKGVHTMPLNCVRRAMNREGLDSLDVEAIRRYIRDHSDGELQRVRNLGRRGIDLLRAWERAPTGDPVANWVGEGVPA